MLTRYLNKMMGKKKPCLVCGGKGYIWRVNGPCFRGIPVPWCEPCSRCDGISSQPIEHKDMNDDPAQAEN